MTSPTKIPLLEKKLELERELEKVKILRKQERKNELTQYCKLMKGCLNWGFSYREARKYTSTLMKRRRK